MNVKEVDSDIQKLRKKINAKTGESEGNTYKPLKAWSFVPGIGSTTRYVWLVADDGSEYTVTYTVVKSPSYDLAITNI